MSAIKTTLTTLTAAISAFIIAAGGLAFAASTVFADRLPPGSTLGTQSLTGLNTQDTHTTLAAYRQHLASVPVHVTLRGKTVERTLAALGASLDEAAVQNQVAGLRTPPRASRFATILPTLHIDHHRLQQQLRQDFADHLQLPSDATLTFDNRGNLTRIPSQAGEGVDTTDLAHRLTAIAQSTEPDHHLTLAVTTTPAVVQDDDVARAQQLTEQLLNDGFTLSHGEQTLTIKPNTLRRLITFRTQANPDTPDHYLLGVQLDHAKLTEYLATTIAPDVDQPAVNARFKVNYQGTDHATTNPLSPAELAGARVEQFAVPQEGRQLNQQRTINHINASLARFATEAPLAIDITKPDITNLADIERLGLNELLAVGESDFAGSPQNRALNIGVGGDLYHGLLIPPDSEFSFNEFLGPVTAAAGFKPELVIKNNVTTPEYGGGLCQVSTSMFRAALNAGLEITKRRNHSYAVRYYGTPGLDATIYPPYTDLRFHNNTPGYLLIQTRLIGTKLAFEFWGTSDGRQVQVEGPFTYDRQPDGAVKAHVTQKVIRNGETIIDQTFYSRYKSPKLFPKVLSANGG